MGKQTQTVERSTLNLFAPVELKGKRDKETRCDFELVAYTGAPVSSWFGDLVIDIDGIETKSNVPILREHERDRIVGWSSETIKDSRGLVLSGSFTDATKDGAEVQALAEQGFPWQASVGVAPKQILSVRKNEKVEVNGQEFTGPIEVWTKSLVGEVSCVSWGADNQTSMQLLSSGTDRVPVEITTLTAKGDCAMTLEELKEKHSELYQAAFDSGAKSVDLGVSEENGRKAERERVTAILAIDGDAVAMRQAITEGLSVESTYKLLFEAEVKRKTEALAQMQASAPQSLGQQTPQEPEPEITGDVAQLVSDKALAMSLKDGIDIHAATKMVLASDKKLASAYRATFQA